MYYENYRLKKFESVLVLSNCLYNSRSDIESNSNHPPFTSTECIFLPFLINELRKSVMYDFSKEISGFNGFLPFLDISFAF